MNWQVVGLVVGYAALCAAAAVGTWAFIDYIDRRYGTTTGTVVAFVMLVTGVALVLGAVAK